MANVDITSLLEDCNSLKPKDLILDPLRWKYLIRSIMRGKNILLLGPARCGKTKAAQAAASAVDRADKFFPFNLGSTQDARAALVGNTFFKKESGTIFSPSPADRAQDEKDAEKYDSYG